MASTSEDYSASEWTQRSLLNDLLQQKWLIAGAAVFIGALFLFSRRSAPQEQAARRLVRDWRNVDEPNDIRELLGDNLPPILRPALLSALEEVENIVHRWFRQLEREIQRL